MAKGMKLTLYVLLVTTVLDDRVTAFILDSQSCLAHPPCTCSGQDVHCDSRGLDTFPKFYPSNVTGSTIHLYVDNNAITSIPADSFRNLTVSNNTKIYLKLYSNQITSIAANAFRGIRDIKLDIDLHGNNLTALPSELATLTQIGILNLQNNPIASLNALPNRLQSLYIDLSNYNGMLTELSHITSLEELQIRFLNLTHLDYDVFNGFAHSLRILYIMSSQLERIPVAICHLQHLHTLRFLSNYNMHTGNTVLEYCAKQLTSVTHLDMRNNKFKYMPDVFRSFPSMTELDLRQNHLEFIHWNSVPANATLTALFLEINELTRIPSVLEKLPSLTRFGIGYNDIKSIEDYDLSNLHRLANIDLSYNPIVYISPHAFEKNLELITINLSNTQLRHLPSSLASLTNLMYLNLRDSPLECDCDLTFMEPVDITGIHIEGTCNASSTLVKTYLMDNLQWCH